MKTVPLTQDRVALVDDEDWDRVLAAGPWFAQEGRNTWYGRRNAPEGTQYLHRFLMDAPRGVMVDHKNMNGLDCRRRNMRLATDKQNRQHVGRRSNNTSGYKGVSWHRRASKWQAAIMADGRRVHLGLFDDAKAAAVAYDEAATRLHGQFARLNQEEA